MPVTVGSPFGEGAGLVEQDRVDGPHALQGEAVLDENTAAGRALGGDRHDQGDGQTPRVGARDHQHGDRPDHRGVRVSDERPDERGECGGTQREPEQPAGGAVGDPLRPRGRVLRVGDQPLDAGEGGVIARSGDLDPQA